MAIEYLDKDGLLYFWQKIKNLFVSDVNYDSTNNKITKTKAGSISDVVTIATIKTALNLSKSDVGLGNVDNTSDANKPISTATQTALNGKVDTVTGKSLSTNDYTTAEKTKLDGIATGAEVNQNAFSNVKVGSTTVAADGKTDTLELVAGSNVTLTPDATNDKVTIAATDTTYSNATTSAAGLMSSTDKTKLDKLVFDGSNKIDSSILPSYVDDVIEAYPRSGQTALGSTWLATGSASGTVIAPESGKIYVLMDDSGDYAANTQFRWSGSAYVKLADGGVSSITNAEIDTIVAS